METKSKKIGSSKIEISFEFNWEEFLPYLDKACSNLSKNLKIPGFRAGKIPLEIVEREIGQDKVLVEAGNLLIEKKYLNYIIKEKIETIGQPKVEILKLAPKNPFCFKVEVDILPEINLPDYKKIIAAIKKKNVSIEEKEIEEALNSLRNSRATFEDLNREAKTADVLEIEYSSPQIEDNKIYQDKFPLEKGHLIPGFEENLLGLKAGEEKEFSIVIPENYIKKELAGKNVDFKVKVKNVQLMKIPELNENFIKSLGNFKNLEELKSSIKQGIIKEKEFQELQKRREEILEKIGKETKMEIPQSLVSLVEKDLMESLKQKIKNNLKISFEQYLKEIKKSEEELKNTFEKQAEKKVRGLLILKELGKKEKIELKNEEIESAVNAFLKNYPDIKKTEKKFDPVRSRQELAEIQSKRASNGVDVNQLKEYYRNIIYNEKVFEKLENLSKIKNQKSKIKM